MPFPTNLVTNEVKNNAGTEVEFNRLSLEGRTLIFAQVAETPNLPHRIKVSHQESGTGKKLRRRSVVRVDMNIIGADAVTPEVISCYLVADIPVGNISNLNTTKQALAELMSLCASTGATTTILYDCTGYGADALANGSL